MIGKLLAAAGALVLLTRLSGKANAMSVPSVINPTQWIGLQLPAGARTSALTTSKAAIVQMLFDGWAQGPLDTVDQVIMVALGWAETLLNPAIRSAPGLADDKQGGSFTIFQLRRDVELKGAMASLGYTFDQVVPAASVTGAALRPYVEKQAKCAMWLALVDGIVKVRNAWGSDYDHRLLDMAVKWSSGGGNSWLWAIGHAAPAKILAEYPASLPTDALPEMVAKLYAVGAEITAGALHRLQIFRLLVGRLASSPKENV